MKFGLPGDKPIPGYYDGDYKIDLAVFRPENKTWYSLQSRDGFAARQFGYATDKLTPTDYDGDGKFDVAVYRDGAWYVERSRDGFTTFQFGTSTDIPLASAFIR